MIKIVSKNYFDSSKASKSCIKESQTLTFLKIKKVTQEA